MMNYNLGGMFLLCILICASALTAGEDDVTCIAGARIQKTWELYWQNGIEASCSHPKLAWGHVSLGASVASSRLGSAWGSNALKQEEYLFNALWNFRLQKFVQPYAGIGMGYFWLNVEDPLFNWMPHSSFLLAFQSGFSMQVYGPVQWRAGFGYHLITGDGESGPGSLYPLFLQMSIQGRFSL